ncbi:6407_t:CDS:1, partial [Gigaspora margarita]
SGRGKIYSKINYAWSKGQINSCVSASNGALFFHFMVGAKAPLHTNHANKKEYRVSFDSSKLARRAGGSLELRTKTTRTNFQIQFSNDTLKN